MNKDKPTTRSNHASRTECTGQELLFPELCPKTVTVDFKGGHVSSDGGGVVLAQLDRSYGYLKRFATCFVDHRNPEWIEHSLPELLRQRIYGLALGDRAEVHSRTKQMSSGAVTDRVWVKTFVFEGRPARLGFRDVFHQDQANTEPG